MIISTQTLFLLFFILAASLVLTLLINRVRRWRQRQRDEEQIREAEYEDALRKSQAQSPIEPAQPVVTAPSADAVAQTVEPTASTLSPDQQTSETTSATDNPTPVGPGVIKADQFMAWSPPEADVWQPPANQTHQVSWSGQKLFGDQADDFEEANSLPQLRPDQVPTNDGSDYVFGPATSALSAVMPTPDVERTSKELTRAGYHQPHAMQNLQAVRLMMLFGVFSFFREITSQKLQHLF